MPHSLPHHSPKTEDQTWGLQQEKCSQGRCDKWKIIRRLGKKSKIIKLYTTLKNKRLN